MNMSFEKDWKDEGTLYFDQIEKALKLLQTIWEKRMRNNWFMSIDKLFYEYF